MSFVVWSIITFGSFLSFVSIPSARTAMRYATLSPKYHSLVLAENTTLKPSVSWTSKSQKNNISIKITIISDRIQLPIDLTSFGIAQKRTEKSPTHVFIKYFYQNSMSLKENCSSFNHCVLDCDPKTWHHPSKSTTLQSIQHVPNLHYWNWEDMDFFKHGI